LFAVVSRAKFPLNPRRRPLVRPGRHSAMRTPFDTLLAAAGVQAHLAAEVDDMAMPRLLARLRLRSPVGEPGLLPGPHRGRRVVAIRGRNNTEHSLPAGSDAAA
jgi:hypothetical protein